MASMATWGERKEFCVNFLVSGLRFVYKMMLLKQRLIFGDEGQGLRK